ncbi:hypothetical protein ACFX1Z_020987 [Malus domestica]
MELLLADIQLGCSETMRVDLRNRRGVCFFKSWAAQRPRRPISEIEDTCFLKRWAAQRPRGPISEIKEAPTFPALSAPVTRTLSFAEIMGILSKISGETIKHAQPLLTFEKTLLTRLLAPKSKRHRPPNLESQTPNMITFSKIEERVKEQYHCWIIGKSMCVNLCASWQGRLANMHNLYSHSRKHSQQDCLLQNRRGTALRISRARLPT